MFQKNTYHTRKKCEDTEDKELTMQMKMIDECAAKADGDICKMCKLLDDMSQDENLSYSDREMAISALAKVARFIYSKDTSIEEIQKFIENDAVVF